MVRLVFNRLLQALIVLLLMSFAVYGLMGLMPGDPIDLMISADPSLSSADAQHLKALYGLDQPIVERWFHWLISSLSGNLGYSRLYAAPVWEILQPALGNSLLLLGGSFLLSLAIALPAGVFAALKPASMRDYCINSLAFAGVAIPTFWLGLMLIALFAVTLGWLPAGGTGRLQAADWWDRLDYLVLPVVTLTIANLASHTRFLRGAMLEVLRQDYIRTARAKGASTRRIVFKHALRNALIPVVTVLALEFGALFSGALVTETVFAWPGVGKLIYDAILGNDFNLALLALLLATAMTLLGNLLADLAYAWLDPRIQYR
ncbi:MAG: ABC transporter permease [Gammaproteobacteria bacterium]|nr:ABC transporter permease [Gammaproteobacteria bacterium]MCP5459324.1 ABC transporter permease [Gammaproteobacteria bacterium]